MKQVKVKHRFQIVCMELIKSQHFDEYPTEEQMKEFVYTYFPTFHTDGVPVEWRVEKVYFLED
ncbi:MULTISPECIES: hypothetical protein [Bacillaceae]|uniref:hypothetical protein n=1 Tax=Bacillaceae TaxID=186817 RepID=UPI000E76B16C|nr:hypothetical protein [Bacillus sp. PK3_68]RJS59295.1 hypothetical protein CJ483_03770 [Bacillus sp. PK3_68]